MNKLNKLDKLVILENMSGEDDMKSGLVGIIKYIDDIGQLHVNWENGKRLALIPDLDKYKIITDKKEERKLKLDTLKKF